MQMPMTKKDIRILCRSMNIKGNVKIIEETYNREIVVLAKLSLRNFLLLRKIFKLINQRVPQNNILTVGLYI